MPAIFSEEQKQKLQQQLLENGFELLKKMGYKRMTIDQLTKTCGIAKGTFYHFFKNKEEFAYQLMIFERNLERKKLKEHLSLDGLLVKSEFKAWLYDMLRENRNIFSYMSQEEITLLMSAWPKEYLLNVSNDKQTALWILGMIPDKNHSCDWKVFANYLKGIAIINSYKRLLNPEAADESIERFMDDLIRYIWE